MPIQPVDDERVWSADKRDFVADRRDDLADERDSLAQSRDRTVDAREAGLDARERQLDARSARLGGPDEGTDAAARRAGARATQSRARGDRADAHSDRATARADRDESTRQREADATPTRLARAFAEIAAHLYDSDAGGEVLLRIAEAAVSTVEGCEMASVTLPERTGYRTAASTDPAATAVDEAQIQSGQGPSLDAVHTSLVYAESFPDERWPALASRPTESGVESVLSLHLATASDSDGASLNSYGVTADAFSAAAQEVGLILAAHASVAAKAVGERNQLRDQSRQLEQSVLSRDVIGQAKGILMERLKVTPEDAFDLLRRASQHLNIKLREVADHVTATGDLTAPQARSIERAKHP